MKLKSLLGVSILTVTGLGAVASASLSVPAYAASKEVSPAHSEVPSSKQIQHVIYIIMDNVHYRDIQQMPHLMGFLKQGTTFINDHTILDSHTQDGMLSDMTGKYPSQTGVIDQGFYENGAYSGFAYWTHTDADGQPHVTTEPNWSTFNQHQWSVGAIGAPDMELESKKEVTPDMMAATDSNPSDYLGVAVHMADGHTVFGSPNVPYLYNASSWADSTHLGAFPGWSGPQPNVNWVLQATYEMQTHQVPVTFSYLHDVHEVNGKQVGPGQYDSVLQSYDEAFETFFSKLDQAGITQENTLFVLTTDEGDHYMPQGELTTNLSGWLTNNSLYSTDASNLQIYGDSGALVYLNDTRTLPQTLSSLMAVPGWNYVATPEELTALHMAVNTAPDRTPSFVLFSKPDVYYGYSGSTDWSRNSNYLWNHGTISPDILDTWLAMVGPGVTQGQTSTQWLDHADTMPTIYQLLGYSVADQQFDGVPAVTAFDKNEVEPGWTNNELAMAENVYHQLNAPVGDFGMATLKMSTEAAINATNDTGVQLSKQIADLTNQRDVIAAQLRADIDAAIQNDAHARLALSSDVWNAQQLLQRVTNGLAY